MFLKNSSVGSNGIVAAAALAAATATASAAASALTATAYISPITGLYIIPSIGSDNTSFKVPHSRCFNLKLPSTPDDKSGG